MDSLKSLILFWDHLAEGLNIPSKDRSVFTMRAKSEGYAFLTKTLPGLGKAFDSHLIEGTPLRGSFDKVRFKTKEGIPLFLRSLFEGYRVASSMKTAAEYIKRIRQLTLLYYKLEVPYEGNVTSEAIDSFIERDSSLYSCLEIQAYEQTKKLIHKVLSTADPYDILPRHGPGAVANKLRNHEKWHTFRYFPQLDQVYPYTEHFFYNVNHVSEELNKLLDAPIVPEPVSRLVAVPKDSRGPRLICCEPSELQYIQQGQMSVLYDHIESNRFTRGFINFTDQRPNQELAQLGSVDSSLCTLDLSEASDRVDWGLLRTLLPSNWERALNATRSTHVLLPDGTTYGPLRKFAPMGSACCFPMEALFFWALLRSNLHTNVWVYGDDIIIDKPYVEDAIELLHKAGLVVNVSKSCYRTPFRESCGMEYFGGYDVTYVKYRKLINADMASRQHMITACEQVAHKWGLDVGLKVLKLADGIFNPIPATRLGPLPGVFYHAEVPLSRNTMFKRRWSKDLQRYEYKIPGVRPRIRPLRALPEFHRCEMLRKSLTRDKVGEVGCYTTRGPQARWLWTQLD